MLTPRDPDALARMHRGRAGERPIPRYLECATFFEIPDRLLRADLSPSAFRVGVALCAEIRLAAEMATGADNATLGRRDDPFDHIPEGCSPVPLILMNHPSLPRGRKAAAWRVVAMSICSMAYQARLEGVGDGYTLTTTHDALRNHAYAKGKEVRDALDWLRAAGLMEIASDSTDESLIHIKFLFRYSRDGGRG